MTTPGIIRDLPEADYHARPELSSTGARAILKSPAHYIWQRDHRVHKQTFDVGTCVHTLVLGKGWEVDVLDFDNWMTKAAKEAKAAARAAGRVPVLRKDFDECAAMANAILMHPPARELFDVDGDAEVSAFGVDPVTGVGLRCRVDYLPDRGDGPTVAVDVKTAKSADPEQFARSAAEYGYDIQSELYREVIRLARGDERVEFRFVVVENTPPYLPSVIELDAQYEAIGRQWMRRAIDRYAACVASGEWPGYGDQTHVVGPPSWLSHSEGMEL